MIGEGLNYPQARALEQMGMLQYNGAALQNKIRGISPKNKKMGLYVAVGMQLTHYFANQISNEVLNWLGR